MSSLAAGFATQMHKRVMDWANPIPPIRETQGVRPIPYIASESAEESEEDMSSLAAGFSTRMHKRAASA